MPAYVVTYQVVVIGEGIFSAAERGRETIGGDKTVEPISVSELVGMDEGEINGKTG